MIWVYPKLLISEKYCLGKTLSLNLPKIHALTQCDTPFYFYRVEKIKVFKKLLGQKDLLSIAKVRKLLSLLKIPKNSLEQPFIKKVRKRVRSIPESK